ncbi:MAG: phospholipid carrier-dependent glycosyltransferase [Coxiellaceae bacterium]|nr:phospholipid carrier-dependent glycosyltransferase [Coxiellaceae bacterium]
MKTIALPWKTWNLHPEKHDRLLLGYIILAAISLYLTLWVPLSGEEGNYTMAAMEMYHSGHWFTNLTLGDIYPRPPLMKFLVMCLASLIGFKHVLLASRLITATATVASAALTYFLAKQLSANQRYALWATAFYFSWDLLTRRGWLAYTDPLFSFFILGSFASLWLAVERKSNRLLLLGCICIALGFLTKEPRAYTFYGSLAAVLLWLHPNRRLLWQWRSLLIHTAVLAFPFLYSHFFSPGFIGQLIGQMGATDKNTWGHYLYTVLWYAPASLIMNLLPTSAVCLWVLLCKRKKILHQSFSSIAHIAFWVCLINWLPCWLSWGHWPAARYYTPLLPLIGMLMAYIIFNASQKIQHLSFLLIVLLLIFKYLTAPWLFTTIQNRFHNMNNMQNMTEQMIAISQKQNRVLYIQNATGIAPIQHVAHTVDVLRWPQAPIIYDRYATEKTYNVITMTPRAEDRLVKKWPYHNFAWYLMCHGAACA